MVKIYFSSQTICFLPNKSNTMFHDFNDIVTEAVQKGFIGESCRKYVWIARGLIEHEYEYIGMGRKIKSGKRYKEI